jgi:predicted PurR-regulated permease PerM
VGIWAWCFVGIVVAASILFAGLGAIGSVVLPVVFGAVLAAILHPTVWWLRERGLPAAIAAGAVVVGLVVAVVGAVVLVVRGLLDQTGRLGEALDEALAELELEPATADSVRSSLEDLAPVVQEGFARVVVSGVSTLVGLAAGAILGLLVMYYLLKEGERVRAVVVGYFPPPQRPLVDGIVLGSCRVLRDYSRGRTVISGIVALGVGAAAVLLGLPLVGTLVLVNFVGGYVPYIGAVVGGGMAVVVAMAEGGVPAAMIMLLVVLAANLLLENVVEPRVVGTTMQTHPLVVLLVTTTGGIVGGIVGLVLAVPLWVIVVRAVRRASAAGALDGLIARARPTLEGWVSGEPPDTGEAGAP